MRRALFLAIALAGCIAAPPAETLDSESVRVPLLTSGDCSVLVGFQALDFEQAQAMAGDVPATLNSVSSDVRESMHPHAAGALVHVACPDNGATNDDLGLALYGVVLQNGTNRTASTLNIAWQGGASNIESWVTALTDLGIPASLYDLFWERRTLPDGTDSIAIALTTPDGEGYDVGHKASHDRRSIGQGGFIITFQHLGGSWELVVVGDAAEIESGRVYWTARTHLGEDWFGATRCFDPLGTDLELGLSHQCHAVPTNLWLIVRSDKLEVGA